MKNIHIQHLKLKTIFCGNLVATGPMRAQISRAAGAAPDAGAPAGGPDDAGGPPVAAPEQPRRANALPKKVIAGLRPAKKSRLQATIN